MMIKISIIGNIGVGKTTVTEKLAEKLGYQCLPEPFEDNIWLNKFLNGDLLDNCCIKDKKECSNYCSICGNSLQKGFSKKKYALITQIEFLFSRTKQYLEASKSDKNYIIERSIDDDAFVFAKTLHNQGVLTHDEYNTYINQYNIKKQLLKEANTPEPELTIYLHLPVTELLKRIKTRNRKGEDSYTKEYLYMLEEGYTSLFISVNTPKMLIENENSDNTVDFIISQLGRYNNNGNNNK